MDRKGQEEIVGFVLIVMLVALVFVILLSIWVRTDHTEVRQESRVIYQFLESSMSSTTDCAVNYEPQYSTLGDLFKECHRGAVCTSGKRACEALNETISQALRLGWGYGVNKGYSLNSTYISESAQEKVLFLSEGECSGSYRGSEYAINDNPGNIIIELKVCY